MAPLVEGRQAMDKSLQRFRLHSSSQVETNRRHRVRLPGRKTPASPDRKSDIMAWAGLEERLVTDFAKAVCPLPWFLSLQGSTFEPFLFLAAGIRNCFCEGLGTTINSTECLAAHRGSWLSQCKVGSNKFAWTLAAPSMQPRDSFCGSSYLERTSIIMRRIAGM
eukprot:4158558-Amphidinium_carterae.1